jgi:hypothetical protein
MPEVIIRARAILRAGGVPQLHLDEDGSLSLCLGPRLLGRRLGAVADPRRDQPLPRASPASRAVRRAPRPLRSAASRWPPPGALAPLVARQALARGLALNRASRQPLERSIVGLLPLAIDTVPALALDPNQRSSPASRRRWRSEVNASPPSAFGRPSQLRRPSPA